jgi:hypothetical protein
LRLSSDFLVFTKFAFFKCNCHRRYSEVSRPHLAIPQVLDSFRSLLEHGMVVNDVAGAVQVVPVD